jgi:hypothetical protein
MSTGVAQIQGIGGRELMENGHLENQETSGKVVFILFNTDSHLYYI